MIDIINVVFRFFDFFIIIGCCVFAIKKHVIPSVEKMLREYGVFIYNLESDCKNLQLQTQSIYENIQDKNQQFQVMKSKFEIWQKKCDERIALHVDEQRIRDEAMQKRFQVQSFFIHNDYILKQQLPIILETATKKLEITYRQSYAQKEYLDSLVHVMKERS